MGLGLAAGTIIWTVMSEPLPDALKDVNQEQVATLSSALMVLFQAWLESGGT